CHRCLTVTVTISSLFNVLAPPKNYTLSLHDALPILQRSGDRVRVSAQLIDARTDMHLWAEHYDRELADVFRIQSEIAEKVVAQRSEEHTSELQSRVDLVCRLLLEKKNRAHKDMRHRS